MNICNNISNIILQFLLNQIIKLNFMKRLIRYIEDSKDNRENES